MKLKAHQGVSVFKSLVAVGVVLTTLFVASGYATAKTKTKTTPITEGSQVPSSAVPTGTFTPDAPFSSGQNISVTVPANSVLVGVLQIEIVECADPDGLPAYDPQTPNDCDALTIQPGTILPTPNGSVDYTGYTVYTLPDSVSLGETPLHTPACNLSSACVLYIGEQYTNFGLPHVFSQPFWVTPNADDSGENPGDGSPPPGARDPVISSANHATSTVGAPMTFVITSNLPAPATITVKGKLPSGLVFTSPGAGAGIISGTPAPGSARVYHLKIKATLPTGKTKQKFTLTVDD
jgi:hypothetical protein